MGTLKPLTLFDPALEVPSVFKGLHAPDVDGDGEPASRHQAGRGGNRRTATW